MDTKKLPKLQANNEVNLVRDAEDITAITKSPSPAALCGISHEAAGALQFYRPLFQGLYLRDLKLLSGCTGGCQGCSTREFLRDEVAALAALGGGTPECMDSHGVLLLSSTSDANGHLDHYVSTQATVPAAANGIETPRPSQGRLRKAPLGSRGRRIRLMAEGPV